MDDNIITMSESFIKLDKPFADVTDININTIQRQTQLAMDTEISHMFTHHADTTTIAPTPHIDATTPHVDTDTDNRISDENQERLVILGFENQSLKSEIARLSNQVDELRQPGSTLSATLRAKFNDLNLHKRATLATVTAAVVTIPLLLFTYKKVSCCY